MGKYAFIMVIGHKNNKGVYFSRIEAIFNSKSEYIILMDPDDMYLNQNLFRDLYNYNLKNNLDIIEFTVFNIIEGEKKIFQPKYKSQSHYHKFIGQIINQPELSSILFKDHKINKFSHTICRNIWNKMIRRDLFSKMCKYIGKDYLKNYVITADDMAMNLIIYHFARNFTNIDIPGYLYTIRSVSMSRGNGGDKLLSTRAINYYFYFIIFYTYIKQFNYERLSLFYEIWNLQKYIFIIKDLNLNFYISEIIKFLNSILDDNYADKNFKKFINIILLYFEEE